MLDGRRWLSAHPDDVPSVVDALADDGVDRVALVTRDREDASRLDGWRAERVEAVGGELEVVLLVR